MLFRSQQRPLEILQLIADRIDRLISDLDRWQNRYVSLPHQLLGLDLRPHRRDHIGRRSDELDARVENWTLLWFIAVDPRLVRRSHEEFRKLERQARKQAGQEPEEKSIIFSAEDLGSCFIEDSEQLQRVEQEWEDIRDEAIDRFSDRYEFFRGFLLQCTKQQEFREISRKLTRAKELRQEGKFEQAIENYSKAIELKPDYAYAYINRGNLYLKTGKTEAALKDYNKAIELKPDYVVCYDNLGLAYAYKGEYPEAIKSFEKAIELDPKYADAHFNLGLLYYEKLEKPDLAIKSFEEFVKLSDKTEKVAQARQLIEELQSEVKK